MGRKLGDKTGVIGMLDRSKLVVSLDMEEIMGPVTANKFKKV